MSLSDNLRAMIDAPRLGGGMDVIIVSTTSPEQERFWQERLAAGRGQVCQEGAEILVVREDWPGGAGNGLGTLYALRQAAEKARELHGADLLARLEDGAAVVLYHTAGQGTRLAPLPGSEGNNKSAVKLPGLLTLGGRTAALTILEAVIRQTAVYAPSRRGRLSVFWGDQVFIPSAAASYTPGHHVDILARLAPLPGAEAWRDGGLHKYGLIAVGRSGDAAQVEKIAHATAVDLIGRGVISAEGGIGVSLGSFSVSAAMARALLEEFAEELDAREGKLDTDPHFWMPMTLDEQTYLEIMGQKGVAPAVARPHHERMRAFLRRFRAATGGDGILGCVDVGPGCYWWDYGHLSGYFSANLKLIEDGPEGEAMRSFFGVADRLQASAPAPGGGAELKAGSSSGRGAAVGRGRGSAPGGGAELHPGRCPDSGAALDQGSGTGQGSNLGQGCNLGVGLDVDGASVLLDCRIRGGRIRRSVLVGVDAEVVEIDGSLLINVAAPGIRGEGGLLYNVCDSSPISIEAGQGRADAFLPGRGQCVLRTTLDRDGKEDWPVQLPGNPLSYEELYRAHLEASAVESAALAAAARERIRRLLGGPAAGEKGAGLQPD